MGGRGAMRFGRAFLAVLAICAAGEVARATEDEVMLQVGIVLDGLNRGEEVDAVARKLAALGEEALQVLFPAYQESLSQFRGSARGDAIRTAFGYVPDPTLAAFLREVAVGEVPAHQRLSALRLLDRMEPGVAMPLLLEIAGDIETIERLRSFNQCALKRAMSAILVRGSEGQRALESSWTTIPPDLRKLALDAAEEIGNGHCLRLMLRVLGKIADEDPGVMDRLTRMPVTGLKPADEHLTIRLSKCLGNEDPELRRAAALVLGRLHDTDSLERLVEMFDDEDKRVRAAALWSARRMSGLRLGAEPKRWKDWLAEERRWLAKECRQQIRSISGEDTEQVLRTLNLLAARPLFRDRFATDLTPHLKDEDALIRKSVCQALGRLGAPETVPALLGTLDDDDEAVRAAALSALSRITGLDLPADRAQWESALKAAE